MTATAALGLRDDAQRFGWLAYAGAAVSLAFCFWKATFGLVGPMVGIGVGDLNPHVQALAMWLFAAVTVAALFRDRRAHGATAPLLIGAAALAIIVGTLYGFYHDVILAAGYVLLLIAAFVNQNRMLAALNRDVADANAQLVERVAAQVDEISRLARLRRFLPTEVADLITAEGRESLLESHRRYIAALFCDIRRFTAMTESMEPEDVMDVLGAFHEMVGELVVKYGGTIGYRAGDGVLIFFNDPLPCDDPDSRAVRLALDLHAAFAEMRRGWRGLDIDVGLGIGIASGYATMGMIGSEGRTDYTAIGNAVNLAARLSDRAGDGETVAARRTWAAVEDEVTARPAGALELKGFTQSIEAFFIDGPGRG